jgi:hypothetical protein
VGAGQLGGVLLGVRPVRLFRGGQALAQLGQLDRLRLSVGLRLGELVGQRLDLGLGFVQRGLKVIHGRGSVSQLTLGLFPLLASRAQHLGHPALCGLDRLVVQLDGQGGDPLGQRLGDVGDFLGDLHRQLGHRLGLRDGIARKVLVPDLSQARRVAAADLLAQREPGDVAPGRLQGLTGFDDGFDGKFGWTHGTLLDLMPSV